MKTLIMAVGVLLTVGASEASAGLVTFKSGAGVTWTSDNASVCSPSTAPCSGSTVTITPHSAWQANNPDGSGAVWASYKNTGITGSLAPINQANNGRLMTITYNLNTSVGSAINFKIWADDTAGVFLNGVEKKAPNLTQNTCANGSIGCQPGEYFQAAGWVATGNDVLRIDVYQVGTTTTASSNPFGVLYYGSYTTPDGGASLALLGSALVGLGVLRRRFNI